MSIVRKTLILSLMTATLFLPSLALAGEIKVGKKELETDDKGKITSAGRKNTVETLESLPGEEVWPVHVWASLDKGADGPLYIEFWDKWEGRDIKVPWHYEESSYSGERYVSLSFELDGNNGFNADHTYRLRAVQVSPKGKDVVLAQGAKVKLVKTEKPGGGSDEEDAEDEEGKEDGEEELSEQDIADTLADVPPGETGDQEGPPETDASKKKGCSVSDSTLGFSAIVLMLGLGASVGRRRRA